jgi:hypothetical protein
MNFGIRVVSNTMLGNVKNALHGTSHALRPKYL